MMCLVIAPDASVVAVVVFLHVSPLGITTTVSWLITGYPAASGSVTAEIRLSVTSPV